MSKQNAEKFLADVNTNSSLKKKLLDAAANAKAWIAEAATAGYEMTADELRAAAEHVVGKPVSSDGLIGTLRGLFEGELKDENLDAVTGGANVGRAVVATPMAASALHVATVKGAVGANVGNAAEFVKEASPVFPKGSMPGGSGERGM